MKFIKGFSVMILGALIALGVLINSLMRGVAPNSPFTLSEIFLEMIAFILEITGTLILLKSGGRTK